MGAWDTAMTNHIDGVLESTEVAELTLSDGTTVLELSKDGANLNGLELAGSLSFVDLSGHSQRRIQEPDEFFERPVSFQILYDDAAGVLDTDQLFDEISIVSKNTVTLDVYKDGKASGMEKRSIDLWIEYIDIVDVDMILHLDVQCQDASELTITTV